MDKYIKLIMFIAVTFKAYASQQNLESQAQGQVLFPVERITNLVICNDVSETTSKFNLPWREEKWLKSEAVVTFDVLYALVDNKCPVLCPKALFLTIQMLYQNWKNYFDQSVDTLFVQYKKNLSIGSLRQFLKMAPEQRGKFFYNPISLYKDAIINLTMLYDQINKEHAAGNALQVKSLLKTLKEKLEGASDDIESLDHFFCMYICFKIICAHDYVCKEVNSDFILFIPKHLVHKSTDPVIQNMNIGLQYSELLNYDYKHLPSPDIRKDILTDAYRMDEAATLGSSLLDALKNLVMTSRDVVSKMPKLENIYQAEALLPQCNVFLSGHGDTDSVIAEISIKKQTSQSSHEETDESSETKQQFSDFEKFLRFLNYEMKTKSLTISSCYSGGKKIRDAFNVKTAFDSSILDSITYPIITIGTLMTTTTLGPVSSKVFIGPKYTNFYSDQKIYGPWRKSINVFSHYFDLLNKKPLAYEEAFKYISDFYPEDTSIDLNNYISVKLPHVSWYSPYEFKTHTATITQIQALTQPRIIFTNTANKKDFLEVVLLGANVVPGEIVFKNFKDDLSMFLPTNYYNQNYVIEKISVPDLEDTSTKAFSVYAYIRNFLPVFRVKEPINVVVKNLVLGDKHFTNVYTFTQRVFPGSAQKRAGFIFTDQQGKTQIVSWPADKRYKGIKNMQSKPFNSAQALQLIDNVEKQARTVLNLYPAFKHDSFQQLEQVIKNKEQGIIPESILTSHRKNEIVTRVLEIVSMIDQKKKEEEHQKLLRLTDIVHFLNVNFV